MMNRVRIAHTHTPIAYLAQGQACVDMDALSQIKVRTRRVYCP